MSFILKELENKVDEVLSKETPESLKTWLNNKKKEEMNSELIEHIKSSHGSHTPEVMKGMSGDPNDFCEIYDAIFEYDEGKLSAEELIDITKEIDDGIMESFEQRQKELK